MNRLLAFGSAVLVVMALYGLASASDFDQPDPSTQQSGAQTDKTFHGSGLVTAVRAPGRLSIDGPIDGVMSTMVMSYSVKPPSLSQGIRQGDKVDFEVDKSYTIVRLKVVEAARSP